MMSQLRINSSVRFGCDQSALCQRLQCYSKGANPRRVLNLRPSNLFAGRGNFSNQKNKNIGIAFCEGSVSTQEAPFTPDFEYDTQTTTPIPDREPENGYELMRFYRKSSDILDFLKSKFPAPDGSYDLVPSMDYLNEKLEIFSKIKKFPGRNWKIRSLYGQFIQDVLGKTESFSASEKATIIKFLGLGNSILYEKKYQFMEGRALFHSLLENVLTQGDSLSAEDVYKISSAIQNFKQHDTSSKALNLFEIIINKFAQVGNQEQIYLLDSLRLLRCYDQEIQETVEQGIVSGNLIGQNEDEIKSIFFYLSTMGCSDNSIPQILANQYLQLPTKFSNEAVSVIIFNLACLGTEISVIQNFIDQTLGNLTEDEQKNFDQRNNFGYLRRAQNLLDPAGSQITYPMIIQENITQDLQNTYLRKKLTPNNTSRAVYQYLKDLFGDCEMEAQPIVSVDMRTDLSIVKGDNKVAVETRMPTSFSLTEPRRLLGYTKAAFQALEYEGWKVVCVQGDKFRGDEEYKQLIANQIRNFVENGMELDSLWKEM